MLTSLRKRLNSQEDGFTLIELMVVVLIIAILIAIAVPTFLGARQRAQNRGAQSDLKLSFNSAKVVYTDTEAFTGANAAAVLAAEPGLDKGAGEVVLDRAAAGNITDTYDVQIVTGETTANAQNWFAVKKSRSGTFYGLAVTNGGTVRYCSGANVAAAQALTVATCTGTSW